MKIYKINYVLEPRKALKFKSENSQPLTDWLYEKVHAGIKCEKTLKLQTSFNVLSVIVCSNEEVTHADMDALIKELSKDADAGHIDIEIKALTLEETLQHNALDDESRAELRKLFGDKPFEEVKPPQETPPIPSAPQPPKETVAPPRSVPDEGVKAPEQPAQQEEAEKEDVFETIENLIAAEELKAWAKEMKSVLNKSGEPDVIRRSLMSMTYLVSVNRGNGSTTIFESIGKVVARILGKEKTYVREFSAVPDVDSKEYNIGKIINEAGYGDEKGPSMNVVAIWIDEFQNNKYAVEWAKLLSKLREQKGKVLVIFALPYLETMAVRDMHDRIGDIMPNRIISVKPMNNENYVKYFERYFEKCKISIDEDVYPLIPRIIAEEKSDGRFYGINTIEKVCDEISYNKMMNPANCGDSIGVDDVRPLFCHDEDVDSDALTGMQKLDAMISLDGVKKTIKEIVATVKMQRKMGLNSSNSMHMMFSGAPGTGKTVVARILGQILHEEKILSVGGFYEVSRKDLVGSYVGHTAPKTAEICKLAYGSIIFIDEAYLLDGGGENDYGKEAIGTLIAEMENKRDDLVVIFAGYEKQLENLFDLNPGLRDRIPYRIRFDNYDREELRQIFYKMLPGRFTYGTEFDETVKDFFDNLSENVIGDPNFSNGRFVRNLVERLISKTALRMQMENTESEVLEMTAGDFKASIADSEFKKLNEERKTARIGFKV